MKTIQLTLLFVGLSFFGFTQVGIGTTNPKGALDIVSTNDTGLVIPRVSGIENVTDGQGNPPENGTMVFDISRNANCFYTNNQWVCITNGTDGTPELTDPFPAYSNITYVKASNTDASDRFSQLDLSDDGNTLAVGAFREDSNATGINGNEADNSLGNAGAVYIFIRSGNSWVQEAYIKASNTGLGDRFSVVNLSSDGNTLAVGAYSESSNATGINGDQLDNSAGSSGAVYIFSRTSGNWSQEAYIKASNTETGDSFGDTVALSGDGNTLAVGADGEDSNAVGINGNETDNSLNSSGAVYVFTRNTTVWTQQAYLKASNTDSFDRFGRSLAINEDGNTLVVGAEVESSNATGINGNQFDNSAGSSGAVYVFSRAGNNWSQQAYIKASNTEAQDKFSISVALSGNGNTLAVGAYQEDSNATGINGNQLDNSALSSGAVYLYTRTGTNWSQDAYIKSSNSEFGDLFGISVALSSDGNTLGVGANAEDSNGIGVQGNLNDNSLSDSGTVYLFSRESGSWQQTNYIKASNTGLDDSFGDSIALSSNGDVLAVGADGEDSNATGINGNQADNSALNAGAVYVYEK